MIGLGTWLSWESGLGWIRPDDGTSDVICPSVGPHQSGDPVAFSVTLTGMGYIANVEVAP